MIVNFRIVYSKNGDLYEDSVQLSKKKLTSVFCGILKPSILKFIIILLSLHCHSTIIYRMKVSKLPEVALSVLDWGSTCIPPTPHEVKYELYFAEL